MNWHVTIWLFYVTAQIQSAHVSEYKEHMGLFVDF